MRKEKCILCGVAFMMGFVLSIQAQVYQRVYEMEQSIEYSVWHAGGGAPPIVGFLVKVDYTNPEWVAGTSIRETWRGLRINKDVWETIMQDQMNEHYPLTWRQFMGNSEYPYESNTWAAAFFMTYSTNSYGQLVFDNPADAIHAIEGKGFPGDDQQFYAEQIQRGRGNLRSISNQYVTVNTDATAAFPTNPSFSTVTGTVVNGYIPFITDTPSNITASVNIPAQIQLSWSGVTNLPLNGYNVWRNSSDSTGTAVLLTGSLPGTQYVDSSVNTGTNYYYWIQATNDYGAGPLSMTVTGQALEMIQATRYVAPGGGHIAPYTNWAMAAMDIQSAVDAASTGDTVLVSNGVYNTGGRVMQGTSLTNRVLISKSIVLCSVNGAANTFIEGAADPGSTTNGLGYAAIRALGVSADAVISGFTITNGCTFTNTGAFTYRDYLGGGVLVDALRTVILSNCVFTGNHAWEAAAINGGKLYNCRIEGNTACSHGAGAYSSVLRNTIVAHNTSQGGYGGGVAWCSSENCVIADNRSSLYGAGYYSAFTNCIISSNSMPEVGGLEYTYCCISTENTNRPGNITNAPLFADQLNGDYRLLSNSPCIDAGTAVVGLTNDIFGTPRPLDGNNNGTAAWDIGACEYLCNAADSDGDHYVDGDELVAGTSPIDPQSFFALNLPEMNGSQIIMNWETVAGHTYDVMSATTLVGNGWSLLPGYTNITGNGQTISITNSVEDLDHSFFRLQVTDN